MARERLTDRTVRRAPPKSGQIELWDDLVPGFGVRISAGGARTYFVMKRVSGKLLRRTVGPAVGPGEVADGQRISLGDAREKARGMLASMADGRDPGRTRVAKPRTIRAKDPVSDRPQEGTFGWVAEKYLADKLEGGGADLRTRPELERKLKVDLADWLRRPIEEIKGREIRELVRGKAQTSPVSANRLLSFVKRVFRWASSQDYVDADPAVAISKPGKESVRERFLSEEEIRLVWKAASQLGYPADQIVRLALVTGQRRGEVAGMKRTELGQLEYRVPDPQTGRDCLASGDAWLLPADRTKRGVPHAVPLSKLALSIIAEVPELEIAGEKWPAPIG